MIVKLANWTRLPPDLLVIIRDYTQLATVFRSDGKKRCQVSLFHDETLLFDSISQGTGSCTIDVGVQIDGGSGKIFIDGYWWVDEPSIRTLLRRKRPDHWSAEQFANTLDKLIKQTLVIRLERFAF